MKRIYALEEWCIDCRRCEVACKTFHSQTRDTVKAYKLESPEPQSRIRVEGNKFLSIAINCRHCADPKCVEGCISGAMTKDPVTGVVSVDQTKCVGCRTCVSVCPFGAVQVVSIDGRDKAIKCDLCAEAPGIPGRPSCVETCPNRALIYVESEGE